MPNSDRRRFLKGILGALAGAAGTVVLASTARAKDATNRPAAEPRTEPPADIQERADRLAAAVDAGGQEVPVGAFLNGAFRNGLGGGFRNGGWVNGLGGGFRNGGFSNGLGGGFRNGAFRNW